MWCYFPSTVPAVPCLWAGHSSLCTAVQRRIPPMKHSSMGASIQGRKVAIREVLDALVDAGLTREQGMEVIARRTGFKINTVQGWFTSDEAEIKRASETRRRKPPEWPVIDVLRYEAGLASPVPLHKSVKLPPARPQAALRLIHSQ